MVSFYFAAVQTSEPMYEGLPPEAVDQLKALSERLDGIVDAIASCSAAVKVPETLFHYTNSKGMEGIVRSGRIWLSDIFGLNDPSEVRHGVQYALNALQQAAKTGHPGAQRFVWQFSENMTNRLEKLSKQFVVCFSPDGDDLSQWRAYGDNGKGFALGFHGPRTEAAFANMPDLSGTLAMNYDEQLLRESVEKIATVALKVAEFPAGKRYDGPTLSAFLYALSIHTSSAIMYAATFFKHPAYEAEGEYRFQHVRAGNDVEGISSVGNRRYFEFDWRSHDPSLLTHIVIGPTANTEEARHDVEECLNAAAINLDRVKIQRSSIPYRNS